MFQCLNVSIDSTEYSFSNKTFVKRPVFFVEKKNDQIVILNQNFVRNSFEKLFFEVHSNAFGLRNPSNMLPNVTKKHLKKRKKHIKKEKICANQDQRSNIQPPGRYAHKPFKIICKFCFQLITFLVFNRKRKKEIFELNNEN